MTWDTDCETALEDLCQEIANGDEARALLAMLPTVRASDALRSENERLRELLRKTAALAYSLADDESKIDDNEVYKAAVAACSK